MNIAYNEKKNTALRRCTMKKRLLMIMVAILFMVGISTNGFTYSLSDLYIENYYVPEGGYYYGVGINETDGAGLGVYVGTGVGNLSDPEVITFFMNSGYTDVSLTALSITNTGYAGTWTANDPVPEENYVDFLIVKGATGFSVHQYSADTYGTWNVGWLPDAGGSGAPPEMSHISAAYTGTPQVPEPTTLFLLGFGFLGLAGIRRK